MSNSDAAWLFEDAPNLACFTVKSIMNGTAPILLVFHDEDDGAWQMLPGGGADVSEAMIVGLKQLVQTDESLVELANLPLGWRHDLNQPASMKAGAIHPATRAQWRVDEKTVSFLTERRAKIMDKIVGATLSTNREKT
jgi:hypothetical protein